MKRLISLLLAVCLLAGCANLPGLDSLSATPAPTATVPPAPTAPPQTLGIQGTGAGRPALEAYANANGVTLGEGHDLLLLEAYPEGGAVGETACLDLTADPLLAAAAERAGLDTGAPVYAFPLGRCLYAYWVDSALLAALLGADALEDLRVASWAEWAGFVAAVEAWLAEPAETEITLNANPYTLPAARPEALSALESVFARDSGRLDTYGPLFAPALLAAGETRSQETLYGALNGVCSTLLLEPPVDGSYDGVEAFAGGRALFVRRPLCDLVPVLDNDCLQRLAPLPVKSDLIDTDLFTEEYNLTGLMNYPLLADAGWLAIPADAGDEAVRAAASALLWLYGSASGEAVLTEKLYLITPWNTASDVMPLGAMQVRQVESGILPAPALPADTLTRLNEAAVRLWGAATDAEADQAQVRDAFLADCVAILAQE